MNQFQNDYNIVAHPEILKAVTDLQDQYFIGYGYDRMTERAIRNIHNAFQMNKPVFFVPGGTGANVLSLAFVLKRHEAVIAPSTGHIVSDEVGAIEAQGHKVVTIPTEDGKITALELDRVLSSFGDFHNVLPGAVYISLATETGLIYSKTELRDIYDVCRHHVVTLYIDGARLATGITSDYCDVNLEDLPVLCDIFSIGGTKNGALYGEAVVFNTIKLSNEFNFFMKQQSSLLSKGFILGAQFARFFEDDLYLSLGKKANEMARILGQKLVQLGRDPFYPQQTNQIFLKMSIEERDALLKTTAFDTFSEDGKEALVRFVTTYNTTEEDIESLIRDVKNL